MLMYIYIYILIYIRVHYFVHVIYIYICIYVYTYIHTDTYIYIYITRDHDPLFHSLLWPAVVSSRKRDLLGMLCGTIPGNGGCRHCELLAMAVVTIANPLRSHLFFSFAPHLKLRQLTSRNHLVGCRIIASLCFLLWSWVCFVGCCPLLWAIQR